MAEEKILLLIQFGVELAAIWLGITALFGGRLKRIWIGAAGYAFFAGFLYFGTMPFVEFSLVMWGMLGVMYVLTTDRPPLQNWTWKVWNGFLLHYQRELIGMLVEDVVYYRWKSATEYEAELLGSIVYFAVIGLQVGIYRKWKEHFQNLNVSGYLQKSMIPMLVFVALELLFQVAGFNYIIQKNGNERQYLPTMILSFLSMISIGLLALMVFYIKNTNEKMEKMLFMEKQIQQQQVQYYESLLQKEEETRKYRHDMNNHIFCLSSLMKDGELDKAKAYIDSMQVHMDAIRNYTFNTGIRMLDSVLNYYAGQLEPNVTVSIKGKCEKQIMVSDMDMCTIFSNLIKNAVEAVKVSKQPEPFLTVRVKAGESYVEVEIENSADADHLSVDREGNFQTTKQDKKNHGLGMLNVQEAVRGNSGKIQFYTEENQFGCRVVIPVQRKTTEKQDEMN